MFPVCTNYKCVISLQPKELPLAFFMVALSLYFCLSSSVLVLPLFLADSFSSFRILGQVFFFSLSLFFQCYNPSCYRSQGSGIITLVVVSLNIIYCISRLLSIFFLYLWVLSMWLWCGLVWFSLWKFGRGAFDLWVFVFLNFVSF